ncbi:MAG TPA: hypothetical protein VG253_14945 [Streptosporangiaceae bacterium]|nr:hypothetical protein [Streptosporangiaceae bacterium]
MRGHVDAEALALYAEGMLGPGRGARVRSHLSACSYCATQAAALAKVTALLAASSAPRIPPDLTERISAAISAEAAARPTPRPSGSPEPGMSPEPAPVHQQGTSADGPALEPVPTRAPARLRGDRGWLRGNRGWLRSPALARSMAAAAAVAVLAGGAYGLSRAVSSSSSGTGSSSSAAAPAAPGKIGQHSATGGGSFPLATPTVVVSTGTDFTPAHLRSSAESVLTRYGSPQGRAAPQQGHLVRQGPALAAAKACVQAIGTGQAYLHRVVDIARFQGRPAYIVAVAGATGTPSGVWVVGTQTCPATPKNVIDHTALPSLTQPGG